MSIIITNIDSNPRKTGLHRYAVRINDGPVLVEFEHYREEDLAECFRLAAEALDRAGLGWRRAEKGGDT